MDTIEPVEGWTRDPFKPQVSGERLYGLGAWDMKSGISAIMSAIKALRKLPLSGRIAVALSSDEELYSRGCDALIRSGLLEGFHAAICAEPTGLRRMEIGRRGRIVYDVRVKGKPGHSASPGTAVDAVREAAKLIGSLRRLPLKARSDTSGSVSVLKITGGSEFLVTPDSCELLIDRHIVPSESPATALRQLKTLVQSIPTRAKFSVRLMKRATPFMRPYVLKGDEPIISALEEATRQVTGQKPLKAVGLSVTDENYLVNRAGIPSVTLGPDGGNYHAADEYVILPSVADATNIYVRAAIIFQNQKRRQLT